MILLLVWKFRDQFLVKFDRASPGPSSLRSFVWVFRIQETTQIEVAPGQLIAVIRFARELSGKAEALDSP